MAEEAQTATDTMGDALFAPVAVQAELHAVVSGAAKVRIAVSPYEYVCVDSSKHAPSPASCLGSDVSVHLTKVYPAFVGVGNGISASDSPYSLIAPTGRVPSDTL